MKTITVSATKARNNFFTLLDQVAAEGVEVIIEKDRKHVAVLSKKEDEFDWDSFMKAAKKAHGILKDYSVEEVSPLRKKGAWKRFGKWDLPKRK